MQLLVRLLVGRIAGSRDSGAALEARERDLPKGYPWPGNVRELEQAVRRILLTGRYAPQVVAGTDHDSTFAERLRLGELTAEELLGGYSRMLYRRLGTYAEVAKRTGLDPRTSRKYIEGARSG